jgi:tetratricopeptide (TPR) repeat protein
VTSHLRIAGSGWLLLFAGCAASAQTPDTKYTHGAAIYRSANCREAIPELQGAASVAPRSGLLLGRCYFELQQFGKAIEVLTNYRKASPTDPEAAVLLALCQERDGHVDAGTALLEAYLKQNPGQLGIHIALADLYSRSGLGPQAMEHYHAVTAIQPDDPAARLGLGWLALNEQRPKEAIDEFERAKKFLPNEFSVLSGVGTAYVRLGDCEKASRPLRQALDLAPDDFALAKSLGTCYQQGQKWNELLAALRTGTSEEAADEAATAMVIKAFQATANTVGAEAYCRRVIGSNPANVTAHTELADLLYASKRMPDARSEYLEVVKLRPDYPRVHERLGDMADGPGRAKEAQAHYEAAANSRTGSDSARMKLAQLCFSEGDLKCSKGALGGITDPTFDREKKFWRLQIGVSEENWNEATRLASELLVVDKQNLVVLKIAGRVAKIQNRSLDAAGFLEQALVLDPSSRDVRYDLASIYLNNEELDRFPRARDLLTEFLTKYEQDAMGYLLLAKAYKQLKDPNNAKLNFRLGLDRVKPPIKEDLSWAYNSYALMLWDENNFDDAYVYLTQAVQLNSKDDYSIYNLALTCLKLGRSDELNAARAKLEAMNSPKLSDLDKDIEANKPKAGKKDH